MIVNVSKDLQINLDFIYLVNYSYLEQPIHTVLSVFKDL